ncbi:MAG TPA: 3-deoxy-D-manno-octulosonic acid transferase, partial [Verrucomicrobiales bacterium]|nr:3-deoxy-D-manno-octulosonic acid transferase [Verrucomicrobiales bacterium]
APDLFLVIVPRHFERGAAVREQLQTAGWKVACRTELDKAPAQPDVLLVDSTGELTAFYETALLVFVGKSLTAQGGQNPIEPAALGRPLVFGPFMQNFRAVVRELLQAKAARQVQDEVGLAETVGFLLENPTEREALGKAARGVVEANKGATQRTADMLGQSLRALS